MYVSLEMYICVCVCVCAWLCMALGSHTHTCTQTHTHIHTRQKFSCRALFNILQPVSKLPLTPAPLILNS